MPMPEATVDENDGFVLWQNNIWIARHLSDLNSVTQTTREKILPHNHFWFCVLSFDCCHATATLLRSHYICHNIITKL